MLQWRGDEELAKANVDAAQSFGCTAALSKMIFPRPFFDLRVLSPRKYLYLAVDV